MGSLSAETCRVDHQLLLDVQVPPQCPLLSEASLAIPAGSNSAVYNGVLVPRKYGQYTYGLCGAPF